MAILAIDAGTTGVTALVVSETGRIISRGYREFLQYFPTPGLVEHEPEEIWQATLAACTEAITNSNEKLSCIGITNQRETIVLWDSQTLKSPRRAIVWQDRRTSDLISDLKSKNLEPRIRELTGLGLDPYFSSSKLLWISKNEPEIWSAVKSGQIKIGTVDSYLVARLSGGKSHITDASNASRTQLLDLRRLSWSQELLEIFDVPESALPEVRSSFGQLASSEPGAFLNLSLPITGIAGDQQAALFGQTAFEYGQSKCTYGTGAFMLVNTGDEIVSSAAGLLSTIAWQTPNGEVNYALEGSVFIAGAAVQWLRDGLELIDSASEIENLAASVADSGGIVFVPALTGLGAPHWDPNAKGAILGITRGTTKAHLARATLEAIALQVRDLSLAIESDLSYKLLQLRVDGGAAANNLLMQLQSDLLGVDVVRGRNLESTATGAAFLAGLGSGVWSDYSQLKEAFESDRVFSPTAKHEDLISKWNLSVSTAKQWR